MAKFTPAIKERRCQDMASIRAAIQANLVTREAGVKYYRRVNTGKG